MNNLYIDFHVIQTVPPSCINRDDTGSPKTAVYGGVKRARVSSQCWKHAMRDMFRNHYEPSALGIRTVKIIPLIAQSIQEQDPEKSAEEAQQLAREAMERMGLKATAKSDFKKKKSSAAEVSIEEDADDLKALFFIGAQQIKNVATLALTGDFSKKAIENLKKTLTEEHSVDVALFGRMVAADASLNCDASSQVAHAISTHAVRSEFDFFTGMDDLQAQDTAGATMLGTVEFNSSTLYRYATVAAHELFYQLGNDPDATAKAVTEFARAFTLSMPTGKRNTFANHTPPTALLVALRQDCPVNLVGAFEKAVRSTDGNGYVDDSAARLVAHAQSLYQSFVSEPTKVYVVGIGLDVFSTPISLSALLENMREDVAKRWL